MTIYGLIVNNGIAPETITSFPFNSTMDCELLFKPSSTPVCT